MTSFRIFVLLILISLLILVLSSCQNDTEVRDTAETPEQPELLEEPTVDTVKRNEVRDFAVRLMQLADAGHCDSLGQYIIYSGKDSIRHMSETLNPNDENERYMAESTCEALQIWLNRSSKYEYGVYEINSSMEEDSLFSQEVIFLGEGSIEKVNFIIADIGDKYYLVNLN